MSQPSSTQIVRLEDGTIPECLELAVDREWKAEAQKWQLLFDHGEIWGVRADDGSLVGTTAATRFGDVVAIGNVLVAHRAAGHGIGRALMQHVLTRHDGAVFILNATVFGLPLYEKLGFEPVGATHTHRGIFAPDAAGARPAGVSVRAATIADLPALTRLDAEITGANREPLLSELVQSFAAVSLVSETAGVVTGFGARTRNVGYDQVGPILAADDEEAQALIAALAHGTSDTFRVDLNDRDSAVRAWATQHGLVETGVSTLMVRGARAFPGDRTRWYSALMQAIG